MSEPHQYKERGIQRWMKWGVVILPPFALISGFIMGRMDGYRIAYDKMVNNGNRISLLEGWKDRQEAFNQQTVEAISMLKTITRNMK